MSVAPSFGKETQQLSNPATQQPSNQLRETNLLCDVRQEAIDMNLPGHRVSARPNRRFAEDGARS